MKFTEVVEEKLKILIVKMTHIPILNQGVCTLNKIIKVQFFFDWKCMLYLLILLGDGHFDLSIATPHIDDDKDPDDDVDEEDEFDDD